MTLLAHISDIHLAPLPRVNLRQLAGKRLTGYLNWKMMRRDALAGGGLVSLTEHLKAQNVDFIAITGDLVNLALPGEFEATGAWLRALAPPERACVSPGNHDAYLRGALDHAYEQWQGYISGDTPVEGARFPYLRRIGDVAIIACSSAVPTAPFMATGAFDSGQAERLATLLEQTGEAGLFRVILIHHPPNAELQHPSFGLKGHAGFRAVVKKHGAEMILHGHTHRSSLHAIDGKGREVPVIGVASASADQGGKLDDPARYNLFRIERTDTGWSCTMREYGFQRVGTDIVMRLQTRIY
jgi:3',5'-cyclic AMP phosphodiesterase CpdA